MENLDPPLPKIKHEKMVRFWPSRGFILDLGDRGSLFHFNLSKHKTTVTDIKKNITFRFDKREKENEDPALQGSKKRTRHCLKRF